MDARPAAGSDGLSVAGADQLLSLLVDAITEYAIFLLGPDGTVSSWNAGAERLKGYRSEEALGRHFSVFYPAEDVAAGKPERELAVAARDGSCTDDGWRVRKDGTRFWARVVITALYDNGELRGFAKITRDDTAARAAHARAAALAEITSALLAGRDTADVLAIIAAHARQLVGALQAWITSAAGEGKIRILAADGELQAPQTGEILPAAGTVTERVVSTGEPVFLDDLAALSSVGKRLSGSGAALAVPMLAADTPTGVLLAVARAGASPFRSTDLDTLRRFADQAAVVVEYDAAQQALRDRTVLADRERIAADLHGQIIRELSWTGMSLQSAIPYATNPRARDRIQEAVDRLDSSIKRIRGVVFEADRDTSAVSPGEPVQGEDSGT
jgi:PAS domain S-box-containing protein